MSRINKARYWWAVLYPENMVNDWQNRIDDLVQVPYAYCVHDLDTDSKSEHRKDHVHLMLTFPNTTTYNHAMEIFKQLGEKAVNTCEAVVNVRHCYDYLIHNTDSSRKAGKYQYSPEDRITGNNFDIGSYEQLGTQEKREIFIELCDYVIENEITEVATLFEHVRDLDWRYQEVMDIKWQRLESLATGVYKKRMKMNNINNYYERKNDDGNIILTTTKNYVTEDGRHNQVEVDPITGEVLAGQSGCFNEK